MRSPARFVIPSFLIILAVPACLARGEGEEPGKVADAGLERLVNQAIVRGSRWLASRQSPDGSFRSQYGNGQLMGETAIGALALLHCGMSRDSEAIQKAFRFLKQRYARIRNVHVRVDGRITYCVSTTVMALAEYGRMPLAAGGRDGKREGAAGRRCRLTKPDMEWMEELVRWIVEAQDRSGGWRYAKAGGFDHSNTQYALLALKEARLAEIYVPEETFAKALGHFLAYQQKNGKKVPRYRETGGDGVYAAMRERVPGFDRARGWGYIGPEPSTGSMTTAGVAAVAICRSELVSSKYRHLVARAEPSLRDGLAWLGERFSVRVNPGVGGGWLYYYLYGLERAGVLARVVYMGSHRWYAEGARFLVDLQRPDGSWPTSDVVDQAFALLFLSRATARSLGVATEDPLLDLSSAADLPDEEFEKLYAAAIAEMARLGEAPAADRARDFALMGPRVIPRLLPGLSSSDPADRARSAIILRAVTGLAFGYDPAAPAADREKAADRWTAWYLASRSGLSLDRSARRIR